MNDDAVLGPRQSQSIEFVSHLIKQAEVIAEKNPRYNAILRKTFPDNKSELRSFAQAYFKQHQGKALLGLTFVVKDTFAVHGQPLSCGTLPVLIEKCNKSADIISKLEANGALLLGSANLDELCVSAYGENRHFGRMINPTSPEYSPLGSSGGAAISVAAGFSDVALGTDFAGSVRAPAVACGVIGIKLSAGFFSTEGVSLLFGSLDSIGIIACSCEHIMMILKLIGQGAAFNEPAQLTLITPSAQELSVCTAEVRDEFEGLLECLAGKPRVSIRQQMLNLSESQLCVKMLGAAAFLASLDTRVISEASLCRDARAMLTYAKTLCADDLSWAQKRREELSVVTQELLSNGSFILSPALPSMPFLWSDYVSGAFSDNVPLSYFLSLANLCNHPALAYCARLAGGRSCRINVQAAAGADLRLLAAVKVLHKYTGDLGFDPLFQ